LDFPLYLEILNGGCDGVWILVDLLYLGRSRKNPIKVVTSKEVLSRAESKKSLENIIGDLFTS
jgi:hypothetical protein